jgi:hypothetical protein
MVSEQTTTGVDFVLGVTEKDRRAIKAVNLFLGLAQFISWSEGRHELDIRVEELREHFPGFAKSLLIFADSDQAVELHQRAYPTAGGMIRIGYSFYLLEPMTYEEVHRRKRDFVEKARDAGVWGDFLSYEHLARTARATLEKMGCS